MSMNIWKAQLDAALSGIERDIDEMTRKTTLFLERLDSTERIVLLGLLLFGVLYLLMNQSRDREGGQNEVVRFVGLMFAMTTLAAAAGWTVGGLTA